MSPRVRCMRAPIEPGCRAQCLPTLWQWVLLLMLMRMMMMRRMRKKMKMKMKKTMMIVVAAKEKKQKARGCGLQEPPRRPAGSTTATLAAE